MALFLKYRPQTFEDLVGQDSVRKTLQNALKAESPAHAYLFCGSRGTGKTSTARIFAKGLNCPNLKDGEPCGQCEFCVKTANGSLIDIIEIDGASNRGIDDIRDLREKVRFSPSFSKRKVYIIDEVHQLTAPAFNALLKTLEEPPEHAYFCLATTEFHKVPETIVSRCQTFIFQRFTQEQLIGRLEKICKLENFEYETKGLALIARKAEGGMRDAVSLLDQIAAETENRVTENSVRQSLGVAGSEVLENLYATIETGNTRAGLDILKHIATAGQDFRAFGHDFLAFLREKMFLSLDHADLPRILRSIDETEKALARLKHSPIVELPLEIAIINLTNHRPTITEKIEIPEKKEATKPIPCVEIDTKNSQSEVLNNKSEIDVSQKKTPTNPLPQQKKLEPDTACQKADEVESENYNGFVFDDNGTADKPKIQKIATPAINKASQYSNSKTENALFSLESLIQNMSVLAQKSEIPVFSKKSFSTVIPEIKGQTIIFYTDSAFHRDQLIKTEILGALQKTIQEFFVDPSIKIEFKIKQISRPGSDYSEEVPKNNETVSVEDFMAF